MVKNVHWAPKWLSKSCTTTLSSNYSSRKDLRQSRERMKHWKFKRERSIRSTTESRSTFWCKIIFIRALLTWKKIIQREFRAFKRKLKERVSSLLKHSTEKSCKRIYWLVKIHHQAIASRSNWLSWPNKTPSSKSTTPEQQDSSRLWKTAKLSQREDWMIWKLKCQTCKYHAWEGSMNSRNGREMHLSNSRLSMSNWGLLSQ